jgi:hypothetical protein
MILILIHREGPQKIRGLLWDKLPILRKKLTEAELIPTLNKEISHDLSQIELPLDLHAGLIPKIMKIYRFARKTRNGLFAAIFLVQQTLSGENERFILTQTKFSKKAGLTEVTMRDNIKYIEDHFQKNTKP